MSPIPVAHDLAGGLSTSPKHLREQIQLHGLGAFLMSNPTNPTGEVIEGERLAEYVSIAREESTLFMMDEFCKYSCCHRHPDVGSVLM